MPVVSRFFGIVIKMYFNEHGRPHFHAEYGDHRARIGFAPPQVLNGELPPRVLALVIEWSALRERELLAAWEKARNHEPVGSIPPLE